MTAIRIFLTVAATRETLLTGAKVASVVGCILNLINQGDVILRGEWGAVQWHKVLLTFCVPFCVSVYSATVARLRFDPGTRAYKEAALRCRTCDHGSLHVHQGEIVSQCEACQQATKWQVADSNLVEAVKTPR